MDVIKENSISKAAELLGVNEAFLINFVNKHRNLMTLTHPLRDRVIPGKGVMSDAEYLLISNAAWKLNANPGILLLAARQHLSPDAFFQPLSTKTARTKAYTL